MRNYLIISLIINILITPSFAQSFLAEGEIYKIKIEAEGMYKLDYQTLSNAGIPVDAINPKTFRLFGDKGGMLPQPNASSHTISELAIEVVGESDNRFDASDHILFFAKGANKVYTNESTEEVLVENNLYDDHNYYFLTFGGEQGKRITTKNNPTISGATTVNSFNAYMYYENELTNIVKSGREWWGEYFGEEEQESFSWNLPVGDVAPNSSFQLRTAAVNSTPSKISLNYKLQGTPVATLDLPRSPTFAYGNQGVARERLFPIDPTAFIGQSNLSLEIATSSSGSDTYLDFFLLNYKSKIQLYAPQTIFRSFETIGKSAVSYELETDATSEVWNVTNFFDAQKQAVSANNGKLVFNAQPKGLETYTLFNPSSLPTPEVVGKVANQNLNGLNSPDLLVITPPAFESEALRLAEFRKSNNGLSVEVANTDQIFNEFSAGRQDVTAIRNFIRTLYRKKPVKYVLLFGDASYDYKGLSAIENSNFVPTYQSRNSLHNIHSYASDDYFTFMDEEEGEWTESGANLEDHLSEIGIGRLPIQTLEEAKVVVDKLIHYENNEHSFGPWRSRVEFFADDGDENKHQLQSDFLADYLEENDSSYLVNRHFMDRYPQETLSGGRERSPIMKDRLTESVRRGCLILDFIGHGAETAWTDELIFSTPMIEQWDNLDQLPLFITATCEFGRFDDWKRQSGAEQLITSEIGGAIALLTTTRPVFFTTNFQLSSVFYENVFEKENGEFPRLGDVFRKTKNQALAGLINRNFSLLGDPSMQLAYPDQKVEITETIAQSIIETDSSSLIRMQFKGNVLDESDFLDSNFDGEVFYEIFGSPAEITTLGNEGPGTEINFTNRENPAQIGSAIVENGSFSFTTFIPSNFADTLGGVKVSLYAADPVRKKDAMGSLFYIDAESAIAVFRDSTPPLVNFESEGEDLFGDVTLSSGSELIARIFDENGIRLFEQDTIHSIRADFGIRNMQLSNNYIPDVGTFQSGAVLIPLDSLSPGKYEMSFIASDLSGNQVTEKLRITIDNEESLKVYPNPMVDVINFELSYPALKEEGKVILSIFDARGLVIKQLEYELVPPASQAKIYQLNRLELSLREGLYFYRFDLQTPSYANTHRGRFLVVD